MMAANARNLALLSQLAANARIGSLANDPANFPMIQRALGRTMQFAEGLDEALLALRTEGRVPFVIRIMFPLADRSIRRHSTFVQAMLARLPEAEAKRILDRANEPPDW